MSTIATLWARVCRVSTELSAASALHLPQLQSREVVRRIVKKHIDELNVVLDEYCKEKLRGMK
jgi:hypothetical protein